MLLKLLFGIGSNATQIVFLHDCSDALGADSDTAFGQCNANLFGTIPLAAVVEGLLHQKHMTRDICMSTVSLLIMTGIVLVVLVIVSMSVWNPIKMLAIPLMYLVTMLFVSRTAAKKRADRLVTMVVKNDVQSS